MRSIVSAVYDVKPGEVWPEESIKRLVDLCAEKGLVFDVVESIPVTEEIKLGKPERDRHIENYCESIHAAFQPDKVNDGAYGNGGCHLHFHLVPKYKDQFEWGGVFQMNPGRVYLSQGEYAAIIKKIQENL